MGRVIKVVFGLLLGCSQALSQQVIPVFKNPQDSVNYAKLQIHLNDTRELAATETPGSPRYDSLMQKFEQLLTENMTMMTTRVVRMRIIYRQDPNFTNYPAMVRSGKPQEVMRLSIAGNGRTTLPDSLFLCTNLEELELVNWRLSKLPRNLNRLKRLRDVTILNNQPTTPLKLVRNKSIRELTIRGDEAKGHLPSRYNKLRNLQVLDL